MAKYRVSLSTVLSYSVEVEAEDQEQAIDKAYDAAPREVDGKTWEQSQALDVNETWQLYEPEVKEITEE